MKKNRIPMFPESKTSQPFTLIELLVVVAIIAILAGMLLPALNNARETAHTVSCSYTLKNYGVALATYASTYDDIIVASDTNSAWSRNAAFRTFLGQTRNNYNSGETIPNFQVIKKLLCPKAVVTEKTNRLYDNVMKSYSMTSSAVNTGTYHTAKLTRVTRPADRLAFCDAAGGQSPGTLARGNCDLEGGNKSKLYLTLQENNASYDRQSSAPRHGGGMRYLNILWFDGHVTKSDYHVLLTTGLTSPFDICR